MTSGRTSTAVFDQEFLPLRGKLLEIASALDRFGRAEGSLKGDPRWQQVQAAISTLLEPEDDRAERIQMIFSRAYEADWREQFWK